MPTLNIHFHPEISMVAAAQLAKALGCVLAWRGDRFVLRRRPAVTYAPRRPQRWQRPQSRLS